LLTLAIGGSTIGLLLLFKYGLRPMLRRAGLRASSVTLIASGAPLLAILLGILVVRSGRLDMTAGVSIVGHIPRGFGPMTIPSVNTTDLRLLLPTALTIVFISVVESIAVAKSLASKRRQVIEANQELVALGLANIAAGMTSGFPVTGGFSRSVVNYEAGAMTGLASLITAGAIGLIVLFFTPLFYYLPQAVLAATVMVAVLGLFNPRELLHIWKINRGDAVTWAFTFGAVILLGIEAGILAGVITSIGTLLWRASRPHIAIVGRVGESELYRNVLRHQVKTCPHVAAVRVDESLYFANIKFLEDRLLRIIVEQPAVKQLVLIGTAINFIDASAVETLASLRQELRDAGVELYLAEIKGPVMDRLIEGGFVETMGADHLFLSTHEAMVALGCR
jgi:SulP family sulfate permease